MSLPKGRTNNPNGRPKTGGAVAEMVRQKLSEKDPKTGKTNKEKLVDTWMYFATEGKDSRLQAAAWKLLAEYDSGKPVQRIEGRLEGIASIGRDEIKGLLDEANKE